MFQMYLELYSQAKYGRLSALSMDNRLSTPEIRHSKRGAARVSHEGNKYVDDL